MPTYEYTCDTCKNNFEAVQKMAEPPIVKCPSCGKKVRRLLSGGIGISFKGAGFYVTDSASPPPKANPVKAEKPSGE